VSEIKIEVFVPESHAEAVIEALHEAGAGRVGLYDHCVSLTHVTGRWRPLAGAHPFQGSVGEIETGAELKLETRCPAQQMAAAVTAVRAAHPYEEPVINLLPLVQP
jgi:hypothetical protein